MAKQRGQKERLETNYKPDLIGKQKLNNYKTPDTSHLIEFVVQPKNQVQYTTKIHPNKVAEKIEQWKTENTHFYQLHKI